MEKTETPPKGILNKIKHAVDDRDEQLALIGVMVRLIVLVWSGAILTLAYIQLPAYLAIPEQKFDPTFIASIFTSVIGSFGLNINKKDKNTVTKADMEKMIANAGASQGYQTIRVVTPLQINGAEVVEPPTSNTNANE